MTSRASLRRKNGFVAGLVLCALIAGAFVQNPAARAAGFTVNSAVDRTDAIPGDGICRTSQGVCSLRAAISEANALPGEDVIQIPAGVFAIEIPTVNEDLPETGDFDIFGPVRFYGQGATSTFIDGGFPLPGASPEAKGIDRLIEIHPGSYNVTFYGLTLREGFSVDDGGAIMNWSSGLLKLEEVTVRDSLAAAGGGLQNGDPAHYPWVTAPLNPPPSGRVEIVNSTFTGNAAGSGAAINNAAMGTITISGGSKIINNPGQMIPDPTQVIDPLNPDPIMYIPAAGVYEPNAGAITNEGADDTIGTIRILDTLVSGNYAAAGGAGVANQGSGILTIESSTISKNHTHAGGGGVYSNGGNVTISGATIAENVAHDGGGIYNDGAVDSVGLRSRITIRNSTIVSNTVEASGGGMANGGDAMLVISDSTFRNNHAGDAGAGLENGGRASMDLLRVSFLDNVANGEGGGAWTGAERLTTIRDSLFRGNEAGAPTPADIFDPLSANIAGGGGLYTENGPAQITNSIFEENSATDAGGGLYIDSFGDVTVSDTIIRNNHTDAEGGGLENSGTRVTFERVLVSNNRAEHDGGGIYSSASGIFEILDSTIELNSGQSGGGIANAPDDDLIIRRSLILRNTARTPAIIEGLPVEEAGIGGGIFSLADGDSLIENTTISGNTAAVGGGGLYHDADGSLRLVNLTIWRNSAPRGGAIAVAESDFVPTLPPEPNIAVIARNSIIGGSTSGGSCDWYISTDGGNLDVPGPQQGVPVAEGPLLPNHTSCFMSGSLQTDHIIPEGPDRSSTTFTLDAIADNGGATLTHALTYGTLAIDMGISPCVKTDQRGVTRPQNGRCDSGAYEYVGDPPIPDDVPPDSLYVSGPIQNTIETVAFTFSGSDNLTTADELNFECRLLEAPLTEAPEPVAPWEPVPPEFMWVPCHSPFQSPLIEEGLFSFEVRAVDKAGNTDPTPDIHIFNGMDTSPPETVIIEKPPLLSGSRSATFTFTGVDNLTPAQFMEYECRLDTRDPDLWLECLNPTFFSNLTSGEHTIEVRATDGNDNLDPTPARYTWTVGQLPTCDAANITLTAVADGWVDQVSPIENFLFMTELGVASGAVGNPEAVPPEPIIGQNARSLVRFALPTDAATCELESATLRLYNGSPTIGRTLQAVPLGTSWLESTLTWFNQPAALAGAVPANSPAREGYQEWDVTAHVQAMLEGGINYGWQIRDAHESDLEAGGDQSYTSREMPQDPEEGTLPLLVLRYEADSGPTPPAPTPASTETTVHCGMVILQSIKLANDLSGCLGEGLVVGAPNIVVDLNGHTITSGMLIEPGEENLLLAGVRNGGHTNVVIRNGTVSGFTHGVLLSSGTTRNVVEDMRLVGNALVGVRLFDADDGRTGNIVRDNYFEANFEAGVELAGDSENSVVENNEFISNGIAVRMLAANGHRIEGNEISGLVLNPLLDSDAGIVLQDSSHNILRNNNISDTGDAGIVIDFNSNDNLVEGGVFMRNGDAGVNIGDSERNRVIGIVSHQQSDGGVSLSNAPDSEVRDSDLRFNPSGVDAGGANNTLIENNDTSFSLGAGIAVGNSLNVTIRNNIANHTGASGIAVESSEFDVNGNPIGGFLIEGNTANENLDDGLTVADGGHIIRNNAAYNNAGYGVNAGEEPIPGAPPSGTNIDGGGNLAAGNGRPLQCLGVVCDSGAVPPVTPFDTEAPETIVLSGPPSPTGSVTASFTFSGSDNLVPSTGLVFECRIDAPPDPPVEPDPVDPEPPDPGTPPEQPEPPEGAGWGTCSSPFIVPGLENGLHRFEVRAVDLNDNFDLTPAVYEWVIDVRLEEEGTGPDSVAPSTRISSAPEATTSSTGASFSFAGSDNSTPGLALTFECALDGGVFAACTTPKHYQNLGVDAAHTFEVRAIDRAGNPDATPATHTWTVITPPADTTAPETMIASGPDMVTTLTSATFAFSANELGVTFQCSLDGGATYAPCVSGDTFSDLAAGNREFRVSAIDPAGNVDPTPATFAWTISAAPVPRTVFCGQVLTQSTLVRNDLNDCLWDGLVVGAAGITIDLDGHLIDGKGLAAGIRNDGYANVTIKNGRVEDFDHGVMLNPNTTGNIIEGIRAERNQEAGITLGLLPHPADMLQPLPLPTPPTFQSNVRGNILRNNQLLANDVGVWLTNSTRETLVVSNTISASPSDGVWIQRSSNNHVEGNTINASSGGVELIGSSNNTILHNILTENGSGVVLETTDSSSGSIPSNNNLVEGNEIVESGGDGIEVNTSDGNQLLDNMVSFTNGSGVSLYQARNTLVKGNDLRGNKGGIDLIGSSDNRLEGNNTSESTGDGISLQALSLSNAIIDNISNGNASDGIYVGDETAADQGMLIEGNTTSGNIGYGIYVAKVSHIIKDNTANDNDTWGIYVSAGSNGRVNIDGGGNRAQGNVGPLDPFTLRPLQCFSVQCDGGPQVPVDEIEPDTMLLVMPPNPSNSPLANFGFSGSDNASGVSFECRIDSGAWAACTSPASFEVTVGTRTFQVRAVDYANNRDASPASFTWLVTPPPLGAPETTIDSGPDAVTVSTAASFSFSSSEYGSTFECALDGGAFAACSSPKSYSGLAVGNHTFQVRARDTSSTVDATPASFTWTVGAAPAPATVGCGEIIVQSTKVLNDLLECGGHGLIVGASNITIDLNGHLIDGIGLDAGILNNGYDNVTISNGTLTQFDYGILLNPGTAGNVVEQMRLEVNQEAGLALSDADQAGKGNSIRFNTISSNAGAGIALLSNTRFARVHDNALGANAAGGILMEFSSDNTVERNEIVSSGGSAIMMLGGGTNTIVDNSMALNAGFGVAAGEELLPSNGNLITNNTISGGQGGIAVISSLDNQMLFNTVSGSTGPGVVLDLASNNVVRGNNFGSNAGGIGLSESSGNTIEANNASGTLGTGIEVGSLSFNNLIKNNAANGNGGEGINVTDVAMAGQGNLVEGNIADSNGGDGIAIEGVGHTLKGNTARLNGGWGIYAAVGAADEGGNLAAGNVEPAQCYNVACTLGTVPGAPETWIESGPLDIDLGTPGIQSNSRNASIFYNGHDNVTPLIELVFECRIDSTNDLAWQDCEYPAEFLNLSPGAHVVEIRAIDQLGAGLADQTPARFEWTYVALPSGVAPVVTLDMVPEPESFVLDQIFTFHANEPDVTFECKVDFFPYEPCGFEGATYMSQGAFEWGLTEIDVGLHTFYVRAIDFEGNVGTPTTYTWELLGVVTIFTDGPGFTPPETPEDPPTGGPVSENYATIDFTANVADATFECSLDLGPFVPCTSPVTYNNLLPGEHLLRVIATDSNGIEELEAAEYEWEVVEFVDTLPPDTTIERAPANNTSSTIFEFTGTDDATPPELLTFECRVDSQSDGDWFECLSPFNLLDLYTYADPQLAPGQHTFEVRARDLAEPLDPNAPQEGNVDPTPASHTWTMVADTVPPGTGIIAGPAATVGLGAEILFEFFGTDNATPVLDITFECAVDSGPFAVCTSPEALQGLEAGAHIFRVRAVDLAGNADTTPATRSFTVVPAPITTFTSGPAGRILEGATAPPAPSTSESAVFVFSANQANVTFECSLDGAQFVVCTSPRAVSISESGTHTFEVRATNAEGVVEEPPVAYEWLAELGPDVTGPNTTITARPSNPSTSTVATFEFTGFDTRTPVANLVFECALDGTAFNSCTSPQQFSDLTRGSHTMLIRARDIAGNFDPTPDSYTWVVELPPVSTILTGPEELTESTDAAFTFAADVPGSTFQCWLDGTITQNCTSPATYNNLAAGDHLFAVLATAPGGTLEQFWAEWEWTIGDITPPLTTIISGPAVETTDTSATFIFTANEPNVTFLCSLDGSEPQVCESPVEYPRLYPGLHRFEATAYGPILFDINGLPLERLYEPVTTAYEWTIIDLEAPDTSITYGPATTTSSLSAYFGFASDDPTAIIQCSLDGAAFSECETPYELTDLAVGPHTLVARAVDLAGNVDATPETYSWTVVQLAPNTPVGTNVTVNVPLPGGAGMASVTFATVTVQGATAIDAMNGGPALGAGYTLGGGRYYDINTTAEFTEPVTLCIPFNPADFQGGAVRLLHFDGAQWIDITTLSDPAGRVCGEPESFSPFALAVGSGVAPLASIISGPPNPSNSGTATFSFYVDHPDAMAQCSLDGLPFIGCTSPTTYTQLEPGGHDFQLQAIGADGQVQLIPSLYEWEVILPVDTTPPDTVITRAAPTLTANYINWFEFSGSDDQTATIELEFECSLDGGPFAGCSVPEEVEVLTAGQHTFAVRAVDMSGNVDPTPATHTWTVVDLSAPDTTIDLGPDSETTSTGAIFEFSGEEPDGTPVTTFECSLDNAEFAACTSPYEITGLSLGAHVLLVRAVDTAGVIDPSPDFYEWLIIDPNADTTPPDTIIVAGPPVDNSGPDVIFGFASNEPVEQFECRLDGGPWEGCEAVYELIGLVPGTHTLEVRALDPLGNVDPTPAEYVWTTLGEPDTTILSGPPNPSGSFSATFTFTTDQVGATFQCAVDGSIFVPCTSPYVAGPLVVEGQYEFEVRAVNQFVTIDGEQVVDLTPALYEWMIEDSEPPNTTIVSAVFLGPNDLLEPNTWRFELTGEDNRVVYYELQFECQLDNGPWESCEAPFYYLPLEQITGGSHVLRARAVDELDNVDPTPAEYAFTTEGEPDTTIVTGPPVQTDATTASFTFSSPTAGVTFECALDGALTFTPCPAGGTFTNVPYGEHELLVRAVSPLGTQVDLSPAEYAWQSGYLVAPTATILSGPAVATLDTTATFTFSSPDPDALFQCSLDGAAPTFCSSGVTYNNLLGGEHTFELLPTKLNLLVEALPVVWTWTVEDQTAPETAILITPGPLVALDAPALFTFTSNEPDASFECAVDGGLFEPCAGPPPGNMATFSELAGEHTMLVRAIDPSLNVDATPESFTWMVVAPPATVISGPASPSASTEATFTFVDQPGSTYVCALDSPDSVSGFTACTSPHTVIDLTDGDHVFQVRATNLLGELETPAATFAWSVAAPDAVAPDTSFALTPPASTFATVATFVIAGSDNRSLPEQLTFECSLDGAAFAGCDATVQLADLPVGTHEFQARAVDLAGNVDATPAIYEWIIEAPAAPNTPVGTGVGVSLTLPGGGDLTLTFAGVTVAGFTSVDVLGSAPPLPDGYLQSGALYYDITTTAGYSAPVSVCLAYNPALNADPVRLLHFDGTSWVDITTSNDPINGLVCGEADSLSPFAIASGTAAVVPETTILTTPPATTISTFADFTFSSNDPLATFECSLDTPGSWGSCTASSTFSSLAVGQHTLLVRAINSLGTSDATPASYTWTVLPLPETTIVTGPDDPTESSSATFTFTSDQAGVTFECALDDAPGFLPCESGVTYTGLAQGEHDFFVRARDAAGNVDPTPDDYGWEIGNIPAPVTITSGPEASTELTTATFVFTADEVNPSFECALDSAPFAPCASPKTYSGVPVGAHTFQVRVFDPLAVAEAPITTATWSVVDTVAPETVIDLAPPAVSGSAVASFSFSSTEPGVTFECAIDGGAYAACVSPSEVTGLTAGEHTFLVRAVDPSLNVDPTPASHTWTVAVPPVASILSGPESPSLSSSAEFTFGADQAGVTFECSLDHGPYEACATPHTITGLADGAHILDVRARSTAGIASVEPATHEWTVEAGPPETTITASPPASTIATVASFSFSANEAEATFTCALDGVAVAGECLSPYSVGGLAVGEHTFTVAATDGEGNSDPTPASVTWTVLDGAAPETTISAGPPATTTSTSASFTLASNEAGSTFTCALDGAAPVTCGATYELTGLSAGAHTLLVQATDAAGNTDQSPASYSWTVAPDTTAPETSIDAQPANPSTGAVSFSFSGVDNVTPGLLLTFQCRIDSSDPLAWTACASPQPYTLADGPHTFEVRAIDQAGNADQSQASYSWTVAPADTTPPETTLDSAPAETTTETSATFTFSSEPGASFTCAIDGVSAPCTSPATYDNLIPGQHLFLVRATDAAGNLDPTAAEHGWTILAPDTQAPDTLIVTAPTATTSSTEATFTFEATDNVTPIIVTYECRIDSTEESAWESCANPKTYSGLSLGAHTFEVRATDASSNIDQSQAMHAWTITPPPDTGAPETTINDKPAVVSTSTSATFTFGSSEGGSTFECALDTAEYAGCTSPVTHDNLAGGAHEFRVRAIDAAGNVDQSPASFSWTVDLPADTTITGMPANPTASTTANFTFTSDEAGVTFECSLDGAGFSSCASPLQLTGLSVGSHTLEVRAKDTSSNLDPTPASYTWTISPPPQTTITGGPELETESTTATFTFTSDQAGATFECALDGALFAVCTSPVTYNGLGFGGHEFIVQAVGVAGNVDPSPAEFGWDIGDTTAPLTTIGTAPAASTTETSAAFSFTSDDPAAVFQCSLDGAIFSVCTSPATYNGLALGAHTFAVQALKQHLLVDPVPVQYTWTVTEVPVEPPTLTPSNTPTNTPTSTPTSTPTNTPTSTPTPTSTSVPICTPTTVTYQADADAWLQQASPSDNKGGDSVLKVKSQGPSDNFRTVVHFPVPASPPPGCAVQSATLRIYANSSSNGRTLQALRLLAAWNEGGITWQNQPASNGSPATTTTNANAGWREWNVTAQLEAAFTAGAQYGFVVRDATENNGGAEQAFNSREVSSNQPQLVVSYAAPGVATPTPTNSPTPTSTPVPTTTPIISPTPTTAPAACTAGTVTYSANADAWIDQASAGSNKGSDSILKVQGKSSNNYRALVRFALPTSVPTGCVVQSATLRLYAASSVSGRTLQALRVTGSWTESGVRWTGQPSTNGTAATTSSGTGSGYRSWDVTSHVQTIFAGTNNGFLIRDASESGGGWEQQFHSREKGSDMPQLVVVYAAPAGGAASAMAQGNALSSEAIPAEQAFSQIWAYLPLLRR